MTAVAPTITELAGRYDVGGWSPAGDPGERPRVEWQSTDTLLVDTRFQRDLSKNSDRLIRRIVENFRWCLFGIIICTDNGDGTFTVIDGQHRAIAATLHSSIRSVPVFVTDAETLQEQASAFLDINRHRVKLNALQLHKARRLAGDPDAAAVAGICADVGVIVPGNVVSWSQIRPRQLLCIGTLYNVRRRFGDDILRQSLAVCVAAWPETAGDIIACVVMAVAQVISDFPAATDALPAILRHRTGDDWKDRARRRAQDSRGTQADALADLLRSAINDDQTRGQGT